MSTTSPKPQASLLLGDSWVVTSPSNKEKQDAKATKGSHSQPDDIIEHHDQHQQDERDLSQTMTTSTSTISGPELIMPSIYEAPVSEASWVAPMYRESTLKRRHKASTSTERKDRKTSESHEDGTQVPKDKPINQPTLTKITTKLQTVTRAIINTLLIAGILHLLILPELIHQYQTICSIQALSTLYPSSCIPPLSQPPPPPTPQTRPASQSRYTTIITTQTHLESLFQATQTQLLPYNSTLKQTSTILASIQSSLKQTHPNTKHELDLEFNGCTNALQAAMRKFNTLSADIKSASESLLAAGLPTSSSQSEVAKDARLSTQLIRREQYLSQLTARMRSKADSLSKDLDTLSDHLESIQSVVDRTKPTKDSLSLRALANNFLRQIVNSNSNSNEAAAAAAAADDVAISAGDSASDDDYGYKLRDVAGLYRPVAEVVRGLACRLEGLQGVDR